MTKLVAVIDPKTKEKKKAKFAKSGAMCVARIAVEKPICVEAFDSVPQVRGRRWSASARVVPSGEALWCVAAAGRRSTCVCVGAALEMASCAAWQVATATGCWFYPGQ